MTTIGEARAHRFEIPLWPVLVVPWLFPVLWLTGLTVPFAALITVFMIAQMSRAKDIVLPWPVLAFLAFVIWTVFSALMLDSFSRAFGYVFRFTATAFVAVTLLQAINVRRFDRLPVLRALTFLWWVTIAGGWLALAVPTLRIPTIVGFMLPHRIAINEYVQDLFNPAVAEIQKPYGAAEAFIRPAAPYAYANSWGMAMIVLTPVAVAFAMICGRRLVGWATLAGIVAMIPPAIATSNRTMFLAFGITTVYAVIRLAFRDRAVPVLVVLAVSAALAPVMIARGLLDEIAARAQYGSSGGRMALYEETIRRTLDSPVLGYGAPRPSEDVVGLSVGTQGQIWAVMFSYGFVGLVLFLAFIWGATWITRHPIDDADLVLHGALVAVSITIVVYGLDIIQMLSVGLLIAVLLRRRRNVTADLW